MNVKPRASHQFRMRMFRIILNHPTAKHIHLFCSGPEHHDPEDEEHREPDLPDDRRVGLDLVQERR